LLPHYSSDIFCEIDSYALISHVSNTPTVAEWPKGCIVDGGRGLGFMSAQKRKVMFENKLEIIVFLPDGHLLHTHKSTFAQRHSLDIWPDFESAEKAFESGQIRWGEPEQ
jgi:hypothetical protein